MGKFSDRLKSISDSASSIYSGVKDPASINFERGVLVSKFLFIILLIVLSFINIDVTYIFNNPRNFLTESMMSGLFAIIPVIFMATNRGLKVGNMINAVLITFLFFFLFNVLMEFAGLNSYFNTTNEEKESDSNKKKVIKAVESQLWLWIIVLIVCLVLSYLAYLEYDFKIFKNSDKFNWVLFVVEMTIFSYFNTLPQVLITRNRNANMTFSFFTTYAMFMIAYLVLQSGGFFTHLFSEHGEPNVIDASDNGYEKYAMKLNASSDQPISPTSPFNNQLDSDNPFAKNE
jgi:hypothetical protein